MGSIANEKKNGTLELLFTFPVRDGELIFGKWLGIVFLLVCLFLPLWIYPGIYWLMGGSVNPATYAAGFLGLILLGFLFAAVGLFLRTSRRTCNLYPNMWYGLATMPRRLVRASMLNADA